MSIAMHEKPAAAGGPRARWAWACLLSAAVCSVASCGQRNLAVISLSDLPSSATAITAYYRLDGGEWKSIVPQRGLQQFGIELPKERSAKLETQVFAYANRIPCIHGSAAGETDLDGDSIRELGLEMSTTTNHCTTLAEPVDFPQGKMAVWANNPIDIWFAGSGGKVVHWNGAAYTAVPLPAELMKAPPDWNAIWSDGFDVWIAGTNSTVVHFAQGALTVFPILPTAVGPTDWRSISVADPVNGPMVLAGTNRVIGVSGPGLLGIREMAFDKCANINPPGELTAAGCGSNGNGSLCYLVTDRGGIATLISVTGTVPVCRGFTSPTTKALNDVFVGFDIAAQQFEVRAVGQGGSAYRGVVPLNSTTGDPNLTAATANYSAFVPQSARVDFLRVGGTGLDDLWIAGRGGLILRWQNSAANMPPTMPFIQSMTGVTADLSSLSSVSNSNGLFFGGASKTVGYIGPLFTPN